MLYREHQGVLSQEFRKSFEPLAWHWLASSETFEIVGCFPPFQVQVSGLL